MFFGPGDPAAECHVLQEDPELSGTKCSDYDQTPPSVCLPEVISHQSDGWRRTSSPLLKILFVFVVVEHSEGSKEMILERASPGKL
jgi:hypothetical protein